MSRAQEYKNDPLFSKSMDVLAAHVKSVDDYLHDYKIIPIQHAGGMSLQ